MKNVSKQRYNDWSKMMGKEYTISGRLRPKRQRYLKDVWMFCRECELSLPWDEFYVDNDKNSGKRAICIACSKGVTTHWEAYKARKRMEAYEKYGGSAFTYTLSLWLPKENKLGVYVGMTTQAPELRYNQHLGASGHVDEVRDTTGETELLLSCSVIREKFLLELLPDDPFSFILNLVGTKGNDVIYNQPKMKVFPHKTETHAKYAEIALIKKLSHPEFEIPIKVLNTHYVYKGD